MACGCTYPGVVTAQGRGPEATGLGVMARHVTHLTLAAGASQLVLLGAQVVLAGIYDPAEFGRFYVATGVGAILAILATGRYEMAIPLAEDDAEAAALVRLCLVAASVTAVVMMLAVGSWVVLVPARDTPGSIDGGMWLVPGVTWAVAVFTVLRMLQSRRARFAALGVSNVVATVVQALAQLVAGWWGLTHVGLTGGYITGRLAGSIGMLRDAQDVLRAPGVATRTVLRRWIRFPLLNTWPALLGGISASAVAPVVAAMYGATVAGWFGFASYVLAAPAALLSQAVASVFFPTMARWDREGRAVAEPLRRLASALALVGLPFFGTVVLLGPELFALLPGGTWRPAGVVASLLAPWLAMSFVSSPLSSYATVHNRLGRLLVVAVVEATLRLAGLFLGVIVDDPLVGVAAYSMAGFAICVYSLGWTLQLAGSGLREWASPLARQWVLAGTVLSVGFGVRLLGSPDSLVVSVGLLGALVLTTGAGLHLRGVVHTR